GPVFGKLYEFFRYHNQSIVELEKYRKTEGVHSRWRGPCLVHPNPEGVAGILPNLRILSRIIGECEQFPTTKSQVHTAYMQFFANISWNFVANFQVVQSQVITGF